MLPRTLEPEVMESADEARAYDAMDHSVVNEAFVDDFLAAARDAGFDARPHDDARPLDVLDCGTGTALIPIALGRRPVSTKITALDLSDEMLKVARENVIAAGMQSRIALRRADCKTLPFGDATFDAVLSNSIVHHLPEPKLAVAEMLRVLKPGGVLFVRDLMRPEMNRQVDALVELHAAGATMRQREMFRDSLHAALTLEEIRGLLAELGLPASMAQQTSDRHWTIAGVPKRG